jgi:DNA-binding transcriptional regulator YhcF (GntR family)
MPKWFIDKKSKKPLYLQLKDLVIYYTNTGDIQDGQKLPGIRFLAKELGITYETVRKALKELESEGIISKGRGKLSLVTLFKRAGARPGAAPGQANIKELKEAVKSLYLGGMGFEEIKNVVDYSYHEASLAGAQKFVIFTECNPYQIREISGILRENIGVGVKPMLIRDILPDVLQRLSDEEGRLLGIITTTFHINEVRKAIGTMPLFLDTVNTKLSAETKAKIEEYIRKKARIGFIGLDYVLSYYAVMFRAELGPGLDIVFCPYEDKPRVKSLIESIDVLILSPAVFEEVKKMAPAGLPVFNFMDEVDPVSLRLIKQRISELA